MSAIPHPFVSLAITLLWLVLTGFSTGHVVLGLLVGLVAGAAYGRLTPDRVRLRRPDLILKLTGRVVLDIIRSNYSVAILILTEGRHRSRRSGLVRIPLELKEPNGLAVLAIIVTSTPGTAWIEYDPETGRLLLHVFDLIDEAEWVHIIKTRYEALLMEIFQ